MIYEIQETIETPSMFRIFQNGNIEGTNLFMNLDETDKQMANIVGCLFGVRSSDKIETCGYIHTHVHSEYSLLDGMSKLKDIALKVKCCSALTDHGNTYGILEFQKQMSKLGKKSIKGIEAYFTGIDNEKKRYHLILLAKNEIGLKNLFHLTSESYDSGNFYKKPQINYEMLEKYHEGIICTSACLGGEIARMFQEQNSDKAYEVARKFHGLFGDDFYIEIQRHGVVHEKEINESLIKLAKSENIKLIAANDSHYINESDGEVHEVLLCINQQKKIDEPHMKFEGDNYYLLEDYEMVNLFSDIPEAIRNSFEIALKCNVEIETGNYHLPKYVLPEKFKDSWEYLEYLIDKGYKERYDGTEKDTPDRRERLEYEKGVIKKMGYIDYFLNVWDYVKFAKDNGIMVGPGRGSAAGSIVAYCLKITDLDPIDFDLLFERFLNPDRVSMPDIDMDFEYSRRQEVIDYCKEKYGADKVCNILTLGTMGAKMVIRDVGRVLNMSGRADMLARLIPSEPGMTIKKAIEQNPELSAVTNSEDNKRILDMALKLEGNKRQTGVHACGIVIAPETVSNFVPTCTTYGKDESGRKSDERILVTQVLKDEVEEMGLLKCDFLGLRTMSVIGDSVKAINEIRKRNGKKPIEDYREIPLNDVEVYRYIANGNTNAIFQIESSGMGSFMKQLFSDVNKRILEIEKLSSSKEEMKEKLGNEFFDRMIAGVSLYRPGPMDYIPEYIENMLNPDNIKYDTPSLEPILKATYGVIVYQEQVMEICRKLAGFTMGQADTIRKAMGKKKQAILDQFKPYFIYGSGNDIDEHTGKPFNIPGCVALSISEECAKKIWDKMADFAKYAFNKSHAAVYSVLTVTSAWIKYYYPAIYMCSMMNTFIDSQKLKGYISITKKMGIKILQPDVNESDYLFKVVSETEIRYGLFGLSNVGSDIVNDILENRKNGKYKDMQDFTERCKVNKKAMESLIYSGAFDFTTGSRQAKLIIVDKVLESAKEKRKDNRSGQMSIFSFLGEEENTKIKISVPNIPEIDKMEKLRKEKEVAGFYVTEHPLDIYQDIIMSSKAIDIINLSDENGKPQFSENEEIIVAGIVSSEKIIFTKTDGKPMKIFELEDQTDSIGCVVFSKKFEELSGSIYEDALVLLKGKVSERNDNIQIIVSECSELKNIKKKENVKIYLNASSQTDLEKYIALINSFSDGETSIFVQFQGNMYRINRNIEVSAGIILKITNYVGKENIIIRRE